MTGKSSSKSDAAAEPADVQFRFDFSIENVVFDEEARVITAVMVPDRRRYERVDDGERKGWVDKLDGLFFPDAVMAQQRPRSRGCPSMGAAADRQRRGLRAVARGVP